MKNCLYIILVCLLTTLVFNACQSDKSDRPYIVIIGVDGMSSDGLMAAETPNIDRLISTGSHTLKARSVRPTSSSSNWKSMVSGAGSEHHGVTSNAWQRDNFTIYPSVIGTEPIFPTMFTVFKKHLPKERSSAYYHWKGIGRLIEESIIDDVFHGENELITINSFIENFRQNTPLLNFLSVDHVDGAGHRYGHMSEKYLKSISYTDSMIGNVINAVEESGLIDKTVFIVISDHGFIGHGHGGDSMDELLIPYVLSGPGIRQGIEITDPVYIFDMAATVVDILRLPIPRAWIGRPTVCAFEGQVCDTTYSLGAMALNPPFLSPNLGGYQGSGGLFIDSVLISVHDNQTDDLYYTLDGSEPDLGSNRYPEGGLKLSSSARVKMKYIQNDGAESRTAIGDYRIVSSSSRPCVEVAYYEIDGLERLPDFKRFKPVKTFKSHDIAPDTSQIKRKSHIALVYETTIRVPESGQYKFFSTSDDGSALYINDKKIVTNDGSHGMIEKSGKVDLKEGQQKLRFEYFNGSGGGWFDLQWAGPSFARQFIFPEHLCSTK